MQGGLAVRTGGGRSARRQRMARAGAESGHGRHQLPVRRSRRSESAINRGRRTRPGWVVLCAATFTALLLAGCGLQSGGGLLGVVPVIGPADVAQPYSTIQPPGTFQPMTPGDLTSLMRSLAPRLMAGQVHLPPGTPPPLLPPGGGWLPSRRIVAYYGNPFSPSMGVLDWYPPEEVMARLATQAQAYTAADPAHPALPAIELVADVAQGSPQADGTYVLHMPYSMLTAELALARAHHALLILDIQVGRSTVAHELPYYLPFLSQPDVALALDPEFDMPPGETPGKWIGTMSASEINWAIDDMSKLVAQLRLPPKIVVVHQFTPGMVPDWRNIHLEPGVQFIMDTDGFGGPALKESNYQTYIADQPIPPVRYGGIKLFYKYDSNLMSPATVVGLKPGPSLVIYQ